MENKVLHTWDRFSYVQPRSFTCETIKTWNSSPWNLWLELITFMLIFLEGWYPQTLNVGNGIYAVKVNSMVTVKWCTENWSFTKCTQYQLLENMKSTYKLYSGLYWRKTQVVWIHRRSVAFVCLLEELICLQIWIFVRIHGSRLLCDAFFLHQNSFGAQVSWITMMMNGVECPINGLISLGYLWEGESLCMKEVVQAKIQRWLIWENKTQLTKYILIPYNEQFDKLLYLFIGKKIIQSYFNWN